MEMKPLYVTKTVLRETHGTIGSRPAETGGLLGSSDGKTIDYFHFDEFAQTTDSTYSPDVEALCPVLSDCKERGIEVVGFIHSHPKGIPRPSQGDMDYAAAIMETNSLEQLVLPIVQSGADGDFAIHGYIAQLYDGKVRIINTPIQVVPEPAPVVIPRSHERVQSVYPFNVMHRKILVVFGGGGSAEFIETMARTGIGRIILFDGDIYSESNLATQQCYRDEIGQNKAMAIARRIARIDPGIQVDAWPCYLEEYLSDLMFEQLIGPDLKNHPEDILIAACTDSFWAQARAARLALKYGTPFLAAQLYAGGLAAEVLFTYPGVTPACPRCILRSRYGAYLDGYENTVGSVGTPIFATQRVNALKGFVSLMLLLYKESGPFAGLLDEVADRNMLQIRLSPDPSSFVHPLFHKYLGGLPCTFFDETLWHKVTLEPDCPDCHGCGDLSLLKGAIPDSRILEGGDPLDH
jgi:proteasome lid subunit RPN8/RPN11